MQRELSGSFVSRIIVVAFLCVCSIQATSFAQAAVEWEIKPEEIIFKLWKTAGRRYEVSYTTSPMKVIIDATEPLEGFEPVLKTEDVALRRLRYSETAGGSRLVLDFNYQLPNPVWQDYGDFVLLTIEKTYVHTTERAVTTGVVYGHQRRADEFGPNIVNYLEIRRRFTGVEIKLALAQGRLHGSENVSDIAARGGAIAAVNGAFFSGDGRPLGIFMIDGELISEPYAARTALGLGPRLAVMDGITFKGEALLPAGLTGKITGINRPRGEDDLIVYTPFYGESTRTNGYGLEVTLIGDKVVALGTGNSPIPAGGIVLSGHGLSAKILENIKIGDEVAVSIKLDPPWEDLGVNQIIGGGPRLVRDGEVHLTGAEEKFQQDVLAGRAPRTALGITEDQKILLVTVNGRQPNISVGMTLSELAELLIELGAVQAMNLDGGGSTTMIIRDLVLNLPSGGSERPVSNAIIITVPEDRR